MKNVIITLFALLLSCSMFAQSSSSTNDLSEGEDSTSELVLSPKDTLMFQYFDAYLNQLREPRYRLFPTQNTWTFIKLDTMTGQLWQVQYSVDKSPRMEYDLDTDVRVYSWENQICGRFTLYETKNMYNFILLDTINGNCWQVQWGIDKEDRMVLRIY